MFKLVVLSALLAVAVARPGHLIESSPLVYAAPAATIVQEPVLAKVGAVVKSVPTAISHQSQSVVHSSAHVVEDIVAPVVKSTPVVSYAAPAPVVHSTYAAAAPVVHSTYAAAAPVVHSAYVAAPVAHVAASSPLTYTATGVWFEQQATVYPSTQVKEPANQKHSSNMFKLFVLSALLAVAAARPGHLAAAPLVYSAPATAIVQEPALAKVGAVVKSVPTAVSHQSVTQVHSTPVVEDVVAPVVKTTLHAAAPVATYAAAAPVSTYSAVAPVSTYSAVAPVATYAAAAPVSTYSAVAPVSTYSAVAPISTYSAVHAPVSTYSAVPAPVAYSAPVVHSAPLTYAASAW
ncbi:mucin-17-like [Drosophila albomicans]|uniref:Mucin-17-like n=1 Tax=Drosophila albomicans TaxID=7291 RepID=A0A6P8XG66_DROAB|nr:mucin-17-like [Drosophila albomicans]